MRSSDHLLITISDHHMYGIGKKKKNIILTFCICTDGVNREHVVLWLRPALSGLHTPEPRHCIFCYSLSCELPLFTRTSCASPSLTKPWKHPPHHPPALPRPLLHRRRKPRNMCCRLRLHFEASRLRIQVQETVFRAYRAVCFRTARPRLAVCLAE